MLYQYHGEENAAAPAKRGAPANRERGWTGAGAERERARAHVVSWYAKRFV